jgi:hypothetical protein
MDKAGEGAYWVAKPGPNQTLFFDGYEGQEDVVIDEFYGWITRDLMCRLCDRYPFMVHTKGGMTNFYPKRVWITSNSPPDAWWPKIGLGPMERRLSGELGVVKHLTEQTMVMELPIIMPSVSAELPLCDNEVEALRAGAEVSLASLVPKNVDIIAALAGDLPNRVYDSDVEGCCNVEYVNGNKVSTPKAFEEEATVEEIASYRPHLTDVESESDDSSFSMEYL